MKGNFEAFKEEFRLQNFKLNHDQPHIFVKSQFGPRPFYPLWSLFWTIYHIIWNVILVPTLLEKNGKLPVPKYFIFLTNWGYTVLTVTVICDCVATIYVHVRRKDVLQGSSSSMPWYLKAVWVLYNIIGANSLLVTIGYYVLLKPEYTALSIAKHLINSIYIVMNTFVSAKPVRIYHMYQPIIFTITYMTFSVIWHFSGGDPIYPVLDWSKTKTAVIACVVWAFVGVPVMHLVLFACHKLRNLLHSLCRSDYSDESINATEMRNFNTFSKDDFSNTKSEPK